MPDVLPNIPQEPAQGIQAQLDLVYLFNADAANAVIDAANNVIEEINKGGIGLIKPYSSMVAPIKQYAPTFYNNGLYIANEDISALPSAFDPAQWTLIATKVDGAALETQIQAEEDARIAEDDILQGNIDSEAGARAQADTALGNRITAEETARSGADSNLQQQIDAITASSDVKDIVGTHAELENYDTSTLGDNDIIKVLQDETHQGATTYYRWDEPQDQFELIGSEGPYYTKAQADNLLAGKQNTLTAGQGITIENDVISSTTVGDFVPQYDTMPTASADNLGDIVQFAGTTDANYTNGYFYKCVSDGQDPVTYSWEEVSLGGTTYTAGNGISIDANNEISVADPVLVNLSKGTNSIAIGNDTGFGRNNFVCIGGFANVSGNNCVKIGANGAVNAHYGIAIGYYTSVGTGANNAIQLGTGNNVPVNNNDANTFKVANANGNFEIMSSDGTIPEARLADTTNAQQGDVLTLDSNLNAVWQASSGGAVDSVNGKTGAVTLTAADVDAVAKTGDTITGTVLIKTTTVSTPPLKITTSTQERYSWTFAPWSGVEMLAIGCGGVSVLVVTRQALNPGNTNMDLGISSTMWRTAYVTKLNNGADLAIPTAAGTLARLEDLPTQPSDIGAATAAQGAKADTAVQPAAIANMQTTSNLVTSVSSASTDAQYPSAKLFYETCGDIETLINAL